MVTTYIVLKAAGPLLCRGFWEKVVGESQSKNGFSQSGVTVVLGSETAVAVGPLDWDLQRSNGESQF